jgi:hypothetical protein
LTVRALTPAERKLTESVFGSAIDPDQVQVNNRKFFWFQPRRTIMAPDGALWFHPKGDHYCEDFCGQDLSEQGLFIHEMTHVWQHQKGINLLLRRYPGMRYDYAIKPGWKLERYNLEQQAEIVRHAFLLKNGYVIAGAPPIRVYDGLLPFRGC